MAHEDYQIPEGGVCGAFSTQVQADQKRKVRTANIKQAKEKYIDWSHPPEDLDMRIAEVVEDVNDKSYVPTKVLLDTLEKIKVRHHGDEPTTEQESNVSLIEEELKTRDQDAGYAEAKKKTAVNEGYVCPSCGGEGRESQNGEFLEHSPGAVSPPFSWSGEMKCENCGNTWGDFNQEEIDDRQSFYDSVSGSKKAGRSPK